MKLREFLRNEFANSIRYKIIKDNCEMCGTDKELHLHHVSRFHNLLVETLEELNLNEMDTEDYSEIQLKCISNFMLAKQIKSEYKTLCKECHKKTHLLESHKDEYKNVFYNPFGSYTFLNKDTIFDLDLSEDFLFVLLYMSSKIDYDGYIVDENAPKGTYTKYLDKKCLFSFLDTDERVVRKIYKNFITKNIILEDSTGIKINGSIACRGTCNYTNRIEVFQKGFQCLFDNSSTPERKRYGVVMKALIKGNGIYIEKDNLESMHASNYTRFMNSINSKIDFLIKKDGKFYINPSVMYGGCLDYSFKIFLNELNIE